ncbi:hypothetical protein C8F04DRAFT_1181081 [Mycena alexandri]|uniref:Uncharacterized protein n=1 Tax=Mycena alexandri TaxID=1745969 RepID=A0AAD6T3N4_9AGAR|nr:hypothetical protein C8F04DRAFT_1181081 [Mycena alexandri]
MAYFWFVFDLDPNKIKLHSACADRQAAGTYCTTLYGSNGHGNRSPVALLVFGGVTVTIKAVGLGSRMRSSVARLVSVPVCRFSFSFSLVWARLSDALAHVDRQSHDEAEKRWD